jgi:hypothetical protein
MITDLDLMANTSHLNLNAGHFIVVFSVIFFVIASYVILFSAFLPLTGNFVRHMY